MKTEEIIEQPAETIKAPETEAEVMAWCLGKIKSNEKVDESSKELLGLIATRPGRAIHRDLIKKSLWKKDYEDPANSKIIRSRLGTTVMNLNIALEDLAGKYKASFNVDI